MNILIYLSNSHFSQKPIGGGEISLELIATELARSGDHVTLITLFKSDQTKMEKENIGPLTVYRLHYAKNSIIAGLSLTFDQHHQYIAKIILSEKIQLVHCYEIKDTYEILKVRELFKLNIKVVTRMGGLYWAHCIDIGRINKETVQWVYNSVDAVNYLSPSFKELISGKFKKYKLKIAPKNEFILDIGIDLNLFKYRWKPKRNKTFKIICVAKFDPYQKRQDLIIKALSFLSQDFQIDFFGTGQTLKTCQDLCARLKVHKKVVFHNYIDQKKIAQKLGSADLFVLPTMYEGLPKSLLEAMAVGVPCLTSDVSPLNHMIIKGKTGFLCRNTVNGWFNCLKDLLNRQDSLENVSRDARVWVENNFNSTANAVKYKKIFKNLILNKNE